MSTFQRAIKDRFLTYLDKLKRHDRAESPSRFIYRLSDTDGVKRCAVLCCLVEECGEILVLVTTRSEKLSRNPGDPCLPGGMEEPSDSSLEETALREAEEETNLKRDKVELVATLPPFVCGFLEIMQCYVVVCTLKSPGIKHLGLQASREVSGIYWIPLRLFLGGPHHQFGSVFYQNKKVSIDYFTVSGINEQQQSIIVWGLTARICIIIACVVFSEPTHFPFSVWYVSSLDGCYINLKVFLLPTFNDGILAKL